jgi:phytoene dehydrogenase-like protein
MAARRGLSTVVFEASESPGGGLRSGELTEPGFVHDLCSSVHPMGIASPAFRDLDLRRHGLEWISPPAAAAHPLDNGDAVVVHSDAQRTADSLGADSRKYMSTIGRVAADWNKLEMDLLSPIGLPRHPVAFARFGIPGLLPVKTFARFFTTPRAKALLAGCAAHSVLPFEAAGSTAFGFALAGSAHAVGWPIARAGSQSIANALIAELESHGGHVITGTRIERHDQLPASTLVLFDTSPRVMSRIMGDRFPRRFRDALERFRYGPAAFKLDWALHEPIPWRAASCRDAATVHVGGTLEEIADAEGAAWCDEIAERPFVIVTQPSLFDPSRAPHGKHTAWGYCHVPNGSTEDMTGRIEAQVERFAPGFRDCILARAVRTPSIIEAANANLVGGDVGGGSNQLLNLIFRPTWRRYATPVPGVYLCSAATPPGGGAHGMCGYHAVRRALASTGFQRS